MRGRRKAERERQARIEAAQREVEKARARVEAARSELEQAQVEASDARLQERMEHIDRLIADEVDRRP